VEERSRDSTSGIHKCRIFFDWFILKINYLGKVMGLLTSALSFDENVIITKIG